MCSFTNIHISSEALQPYILLSEIRKTTNKHAQLYISRVDIVLYDVDFIERKPALCPCSRQSGKGIRGR